MNPIDTQPADVDSDIAVELEPPQLRRPSRWQVVLLNDDYTPMDFVVLLLMDLFGKSRGAAIRTMLDIHKSGRGVAGVYSREIAQAKQVQAIALAEQEEHPLRVVLDRLDEGSDGN